MRGDLLGKEVLGELDYKMSIPEAWFQSLIPPYRVDHQNRKHPPPVSLAQIPFYWYQLTINE